MGSTENILTFSVSVSPADCVDVWKEVRLIGGSENGGLLECCMLIPQSNWSLKCALRSTLVFPSNPSSLTDFCLLCVPREDIQWPEPVPGLSMGPHQLWLRGTGLDLARELQRSLKGTEASQPCNSIWWREGGKLGQLVLMAGDFLIKSQIVKQYVIYWQKNHVKFDLISGKCWR